MKVRIESALPTALLPRSFFEAMLPTPEQTLLLLVCLADREIAMRAWQKWNYQVRDYGELLRVSPKSVRGLNVLFLESLQRHGICHSDNALRTLRLSAFQEKLRTRAYQRTLSATLSGLQRAGVEYLVLKGPSLACTVYDRPTQRHCHSVGLMVRAAEFNQVAGTLIDQQLRCLEISKEEPSCASFIHENGLPLELRVAPYPLAGSHRLIEAFWNHADRAVVADTPVSIPAPEENLLHIVAMALVSPQRKYLRWVTDAYFLIRRSAHFDWHRFTWNAHQGQLSLPAYAVLHYLAHELSAPVPRFALNTLAEVSHHEPLGRDNTISVLWSTTRQDLQAICGLLSYRRSRAPVIRWLFLPSPEYLRYAYGESRRGGVPAAWGRRALNFAREYLHYRFHWIESITSKARQH